MSAAAVPRRSEAVAVTTSATVANTEGTEIESGDSLAWPIEKLTDASHSVVASGSTGHSRGPIDRADAMDQRRPVLQATTTKDLPTHKSRYLPPLKTAPETRVITAPTATTASPVSEAYTTVAHSSISSSPHEETSPSMSVSDSTQLIYSIDSSNQPQDTRAYSANDDGDHTPTPASSPIDHLPSQWMLPPIPSFTDIGLSFDKSRTNSAESFIKRDSASAEVADNIGGHVDTHSRRRHPTREDQQPAAFAPDTYSAEYEEHRVDSTEALVDFTPEYHPSIFDDVQSDDNEAYILWSTTLRSKTLSSASVIAESAPAAQSHQIAQGLPSPEPSTSIVKRWSAGEAFKSKEKGKRDSLDNDAIQNASRMSEARVPEVSSPNKNGRQESDALSRPSMPSSPGASKPSEKLSNIASVIRPASSATGSSSKSATAHLSAAGSSTSSHSATAPESRVIMAATVEKLVEKLTSDIDFFLIYRLFISPLALFRLLMARFHWALTEDTPQRQIVRVRTFVTLRHWLLNYFEYDFMESKILRRTFIENLRSLADHPIIHTSVRDQRIVKELRRLFQLKRKVHCRDMTQQALEQSAVSRQDDETCPLPGRYRRSLSRECSESTKTSKRSSLDSGLMHKKRYRRSVSINETVDLDFELERTEDEDSSADVSTEREMDLYSTESQSEADMYQGYGSSPIHITEYYDDTDNFSSEDESLDGDQYISDGKGQLPSPAFSAVSSSSRGTARYVAMNTPEVLSVGASRGFPQYLHSPDASEHSAHTQHQNQHHLRSHTVPRTNDAKSYPRPLSYVAQPSLDSSSSLALSPPESPRPSEPYMHLSHRTIMSSDKKKTWTQYMSATVEQLSKVKRALLPKSSSSIRDIHLAASASHHPFIAGGAVGAGGRSHREDESDLAIAEVSRASQTSVQQRHEGRGGPGTSKLSRSMTMPETCAPTSSLVSASGRQCTAEPYDWSSDEEDVWPEGSRVQADEPESPSIGSVRTEHDALSPSKSAEPQRWRLEQPMVAGNLRLTGESGYIVLDNGDKGQSTPASLNGAGNNRELVTARELLDQDRSAMNWDQHPSGQPLLMPTPVSRPLRRTTPRRDHRASWMTMSSTNSSIFGAIISQGHVPPSQALKDRSDSGNVDRFVERFLHSTESGAAVDVRGVESESPYPTTMRRRSVDVIQMGHSRRSSMQMKMDDVPEGALSDEATKDVQKNGLKSPSPGMSTRRNHSLSLHPHRQTMPIMHTHFHHHYLQHRQSLQEYAPHRRHSTDIQSLGGWEKGKLDARRVSTGTAGILPAQDPPLLEGDAYKAALQETQRQLQMLIGQGYKGSSSKALSTSPMLSQPHPRSHSTMTAEADCTDDGSGLPPLGMQTGSSSDPHLLHDSEQDAPSLSGVKSASRLNYASRIGTSGSPGATYRFHSPLFHPSQGSYYSHQSHENSYSQQRSPMNPRFQNIILSTREFPRPSPSVVLRFRSEVIAEQLCLIERELLNQIPWYELVNAGWKKKPSESMTMSDGDERDDEELDLKGTDQETPEMMSPFDKPPLVQPKRPWPLSRSQTARTHTQRFPQQSQTKDSPKVTQLVDRFNLTCHWVTSEILKTTDLEQRVKVVEKFIRIAHACFSLSNFSSLTQIMLGLQAYEVSRLNRTWARVRPQEMKVMQDLIEYTSPFHNWKHLRNAMKNIADEWGGAARVGAGAGAGTSIAVTNEGSTSTLAVGAGNRQHQQQSQQQSFTSVAGVSLFSKMSISSSSSGKDKDKERDKDKEKEKDKDKQSSHHRQASHQHSSSFGRSSSHSVSAAISGHSKSLSGPVFPALVSSLTKDKEKDKDNKQKDRQCGSQSSPYHSPQDKEKTQQQQQQSKAHRGSIPFLGVYLSDLLYNTELPSYVEPKTTVTANHAALTTTTTATKSPQVNVLESKQQQLSSLPSPPQSAAAASPMTGFPEGQIGTQSTSGKTSLSWMVNLHKHRTIATIIKRILTFRTIASRYPFVKDTELYETLMEIEALDSSEMERMSEMCEEKAPSALASPIFAK
ncbi:hypothetical protein BGX28_005235 [Mortierella sp. GBA30]|nr:hypothetical protein BGX28_005235 [Mortierella sp. GBA30]